MLNETIREVFSRGRVVYDPTMQGKRVEGEEFEQKEIIGYAYTVVVTRHLHDDLRDMMKYAEEVFKKDWLTVKTGNQWFHEMVSTVKNPDEWWKGTGLEKYWKEFGLEEDGRFSYTYGERLSVTIPQLIRCMKRNKYMRGAVATVYESSRDLTNMGKRRTPCTIAYQFLVRNEVGEDILTTLVYQRSCDLVNFFALDVYKAARLGEYVANNVGAKFKYFIHFIGSLHAYKRDVPSDRQW
jgi:thymidylate synthase